MRSRRAATRASSTSPGEVRSLCWGARVRVLVRVMIPPCDGLIQSGQPRQPILAKIVNCVNHPDTDTAGG